MAKTFDDLASRTMNKASQRRAANRTKALLRETLLSELRRGTDNSQKARAAKLKLKALEVLERDLQATTPQKLAGEL